MQVTFKNFGTLTEGTIDLKPLTLICGPNNTGKTYVMYALYGLLGLRTNPRFSFLRQPLEQLASQGVLELDAEAVLSNHWTEAEKRVGAALKGMLPFLFTADPSVFETAEIHVRNPPPKALAAFQGAAIKSATNAPSGRELLQVEKSAGTLIVKMTQTGKLPPEMVEATLSHEFSRAILAPWGGQVFLLPAERAGLNLFYRELNNRRTALLHHASKPQVDIGELFRDLISRYPQPIADYIDMLNALPDLKKQKGVYHGLAAELQKQLLGIKKYHIDREGNVLFTPKKSEKGMNLHLGSSTVKSLFGLWFYLEHLSRAEDVLMIDEPELNLHPASQRRMARIIARLVNQGTRVIVSTHSDYLVREINSLIMLGAVPEKGREIAARHNVAPEEMLSPDKVAAFHFKGREIAPMEVSGEEGVIAETFDEVIRALNRDSQEIFWETTEARAAIK